MKNLIRIAAAGLLLMAAAGILAQDAPSGATNTDTEINLLKLEMQRLRSDVEIMKGHIGRLVQYLQQRDAQSIAPQVQPPAPQAQAQGPKPAVGPTTATISIANAPSIGRADAPVTMVEFSDFECPFCQRFFRTTLQDIKRDFIDTGKVRYVFLDFPLEQMHPNARKAAEAAHCAAEQGKFWPMHDLLFDQSQQLNFPLLLDNAKTLQLQLPAYEQCLRSGKHAATVNRGLTSGRSAGINATPSFIISRSGRGEAVNSGTLITGVQPYEQFRQAIQQALGGEDR